MRIMKYLAAAVLLATLPAVAQDKTAKIHGHIQDAVGAPVANVLVIVSDDPSMKNPKATFTSDADGNYTGTGIAPGTYAISVRRADMPKDKILDQYLEVKLQAGQDVTQDFDMTRASYISKLTPEERKQVEETRKKNAEVLKENAGIKNLNVNLLKARQDNKDKNYTEAESLMLEATAASPTAPVLWVELGNAQSGLKKYSDAETSLKKAVDLDTASKKPDAQTIGVANSLLGEAYVNEKKVPEAVAAYDAAAKANPAGAASYYRNEAILMARISDNPAAMPASAAAADKSIAADPNNPVAYYLKGQALLNTAKYDDQTKKLIPPPGCVEAYQKYLELAPTGQFSAEVKSLLSEIGQSQKTSYTAKKK